MSYSLLLFIFALSTSHVFADSTENMKRNYEKRIMQMMEDNDLLDYETEDSDLDKRHDYRHYHKRDPGAHRTEMYDDLTSIYTLGRPYSGPSSDRIVHVDENDDSRNIPKFCTQFYNPGFGDARLPKFYYSLKDKTCLPFLYGGSEGNKNRFDSFDDCMRTCNVGYDEEPN
nr:hypothetical transcript [Hymenolepis microstoma]